MAHSHEQAVRQLGSQTLAASVRHIFSAVPCVGVAQRSEAGKDMQLTYNGLWWGAMTQDQATPKSRCAWACAVDTGVH